MQESDEPFKRFYSTTRDNETYSFYVVICADALSLDTLGKLDLSCKENGNENLIVLTVACSTKTDGFQAAAELLALKQIPTLVCNTSRYGGSGIYLTHSVRERFSNSPGQSTWLEAASEAVMILNFTQDFLLSNEVFLIQRSGDLGRCAQFCMEKNLRGYTTISRYCKTLINACKRETLEKCL